MKYTTFGYYMFEIDSELVKSVEPPGLIADLDESAIEINAGGFESRLEQFPGNCSTLVLSGIQELYNVNKSAFDITVQYAIDICKLTAHAGLMISTTDQGLVDHVIDQFEFFIIVSDLLNHHSGSDNTFLIKHVKCTESDVYSDDSASGEWDDGDDDLGDEDQD